MHIQKKGKRPLSDNEHETVAGTEAGTKESTRQPQVATQKLNHMVLMLKMKNTQLYEHW